MRLRAWHLRILLVALVLGGAVAHVAKTSGNPSGALEVNQAVEADLAGRVVRVLDGDTVDLLVPELLHRSGLGTVRVRLLGIDAPENGQAFGMRAKETLAGWVSGQTVQVLSRGPDRYGRILGKILLEGRDVNLAMVEAGMAWHYAHYSNNQYLGDAARYAAAERSARAQGLGLWVDPPPAAPWDWRHRH